MLKYKKYEEQIQNIVKSNLKYNCFKNSFLIFQNMWLYIQQILNLRNPFLKFLSVLTGKNYRINIFKNHRRL